MNYQSLLLGIAENASSEMGMNRLFLTIELLTCYLLKSDMRRQITPNILAYQPKTNTGSVKFITADHIETEVNQYIIKNKKSELCISEIDAQTSHVKTLYLVKLAASSQRLSFSIYRDNVDPENLITELEAWVEHVVANLRNDALIRRISHSFETNLVNHLKGDKDFSVDPYDDELYNTGIEVNEMHLQEKDRMIIVPNQPMSPTLPPKKDFQISKFFDNQPLNDSESKLLDVSIPQSPIRAVQPQAILLSLDETQGIQQNLKKISEYVDTTTPEQAESLYGVVKGSVPEEVYTNYQRKLAELLSNVYLETNSNWKLIEEKDGLRLWAQNHDTYIIQRSEIEIDYPIDVIRDYVCDPNFRFKYDELLKSIEVIKKLSDQVALVKVVIKGKFPVSDREFISCKVAFWQNKDVNACFNSDIHVYELYSRFLSAS